MARVHLNVAGVLVIKCVKHRHSNMYSHLPLDVKRNLEVEF
jgi:hypothetical protein